MKKRTLTVRGVPEPTLEQLRARAVANRRSLNGELLAVLDRAACFEDPAEPGRSITAPAPTTAPSTGPWSSLPPGREARSAVYSSADDFFAAVDREALARFCRHHRIAWLAVFGSSVRGDARPDSDVDVVVEFEPGQTPGFGIVRVATGLRPVLGGRRVDLVTRRGLAPRLRDRILAEARTLYAAR